MEQSIFEGFEKLKKLKDEKTSMNQKLKNLTAEISEIESELIAWMVNTETPSFTHKGSCFRMVLKKYPDADSDHKDELYEELKQRGYEHIFTIDPRTLKSTLREITAQNEDILPDWLEGLVKNYEKASIRIYT